MPQYWILSMTEDNYLIAKQHSLLGITKYGKKMVYEMTIGDMFTFYISRKSVDSPANDPAHQIRKMRGIARVTGEAFESNEVIWSVRAGELFPYRRTVEFLSDTTASARLLLEELSYVTNTRYWALPLRKGYVEITQRDFDRIRAALQTQNLRNNQ